MNLEIQDESSIPLARRLAFLGLTEEDAQHLALLSPKFAASADEFVEVFYKHLLSFPEAAQFLKDPQRVARLKQLQRDHLLSMLECRWDGDYVRRRNAVGLTHADVGIGPEIFLGAYNQYLQYCFYRFLDSGTSDARIPPWMPALVKAVFLDVGLTLDAYFEQSSAMLRQALQVLDRTNAELRRFAEFTSHDLKTPLATVAGLCEEALDESGDRMPAEARTLVEAARQRVFKMSRTIDELLAASMHDAPHVGDIALDEVLDQAVEGLRPMMEDLQIEFAVQRPLPCVRADPVMLREVFHNLLTNAIKFSDKRHGRIEVSARSERASCVLTICDNGPGIPVEELERVFVPFRRLPMHRNVPGSGLGLYFTKQIVEKLGGRIWVESDPGRGSRFHIELRNPIDANG